MARVIIFSRTFPAYHPRAGQPTYFIEKIWECLGLPEKEYSFNCPDEYVNYLRLEKDDIWGKYHTIRTGSRWKAGDKFSPRIWSGKPYRSPQIIIAPDIEIKQVWDFEIKTAYKELPLDYEADVIINHRFYHTDDEIMKRLAHNDGLSLAELLQWLKYPKPFRGQILCWNENEKY